MPDHQSGDELTQEPHPRSGESGNVIFFILLGIILLGAVTAAVRSGGSGGNAIDREQASIQASDIRQAASDIEKAVALLLQNGISESDIRFAHPNADASYGSITDNPARQVFSNAGGGAAWRKLPTGSGNAVFEFSGRNHLPAVGSSSRGDLIAILPNIENSVCARLNRMNGYAENAVTPKDTGACLFNGNGSRFRDGSLYEDNTPETVDESTFAIKPAMEACIACGGVNYFYHVLIAR